jgi:hypothetical protein
MRCNRCNNPIHSQLSKFFWCGAVFGGATLLAGLVYFNVV